MKKPALHRGTCSRSARKLLLSRVMARMHHVAETLRGRRHAALAGPGCHPHDGGPIDAAGMKLPPSLVHTLDAQTFARRRPTSERPGRTSPSIVARDPRLSARARAPALLMAISGGRWYRRPAPEAGGCDRTVRGPRAPAATRCRSSSIVARRRETPGKESVTNVLRRRLSDGSSAVKCCRVAAPCGKARYRPPAPVRGPLSARAPSLAGRCSRLYHLAQAPA